MNTLFALFASQKVSVAGTAAKCIAVARRFAYPYLATLSARQFALNSKSMCSRGARRRPFTPAFTAAKMIFTSLLAFVFLATYQANKSIISATVMIFHMLSVGCTQFKIFNSIIKTVFILMMNNLARKQFTTDMLFHNKSITVFINTIHPNAHTAIRINIVMLCKSLSGLCGSSALTFA